MYIKLVEMKRLLENLFYGAAGLALLIGGVCWFCYDEFDFRQILMIVIGSAFVAGCVFMIRQDAKNGALFSKARKKTKEQWNRAARSKQDLPFAMLAERFAHLVKCDELAVAESDFLSWNSASYGDIRIYKINAADWLAIFWVHSSVALSGSRMLKICQVEGVDLPASCLKMKPNGLAIYRESTLSIFPAPLKTEFEDAFLDTVLQPTPAFSRWLEEYCEDA